MTKDKPFSILDCTIRDGGYVNNWNFSESFAKELYNSCAKAGVDIVEIGFLGKGDEMPLWQKVTPREVALVKSVENGPLISVMMEADTVGLKLNTPDKTGIDVLRIALNRDTIEKSLQKMKNYKKQGYLVFLQLMGITGYSDMQILNVVKQIDSSGYVDVIGLGDSYGSLLPKKTEYIIKLIKNNTKLKVALHPHNNMQLGMSNIMAAIDAGADYVDGSVSGMGRGGGNVPLELLVGYYGKQYPEYYDVTPILSFIDGPMVEISRDYSWGYSLPNLLSGIYESHPYYTGKLVEKREYTIEQILAAVKIINEQTHVIGFSNDLLIEIIETKMLLTDEERIKALQDYVAQHANKVSYQNRYKGKKFLVLGNGPLLVKKRVEIEAFIQENEPIVLGANSLDGIQVDYHAFNNQRRYNQYRTDVLINNKVLLGPSITPVISDVDCEKIICFNSNMTALDIIDGVITSKCRSISILLGAVALVMGASELYFAGLDGYLGGKSLFYSEDENLDQEYMSKKHNENQVFISQLKQCAVKSGCTVFKSITKSTYEF